MEFCTTKDKDSILDYGFDWGTCYLADADSIISSIWTADDGITVVSDAISEDGRSTSVILSGGTTWETYKVVNRIALNDGVRKVEILIINYYLTIK